MILNVVQGLIVTSHLGIASGVNIGIIIVISLPLVEMSAAETLERETLLPMLDAPKPTSHQRSSQDISPSPSSHDVDTKSLFISRTTTNCSVCTLQEGKG